MNEKITGAEYAERILRPVDPKRNIDHLLEELSPETGLGWESTLLELKDTCHPVKNRPDPDDKYPQKFEWNVVKAFIELANAYCGCVVIGLGETEMHEIVPGEWNPDGIKGEENTIVDHAQKVLLAGKN